MEYAKDIILNDEKGQEVRKDWIKISGRRKNNKKGVVVSKLFDKLLGHKMVVTVVFVTAIFMVLDVFLVNSFINLLAEI